MLHLDARADVSFVCFIIVICFMQRKAAEKRVAELKRAGGTPSAPAPAETQATVTVVEEAAVEPVPAPMYVLLILISVVISVLVRSG
jgi:hypothetical protein